MDVAGKQKLLRELAAAAAAVVQQWAGSAGGKQPKEARKQLRSMLGDARQQLAQGAAEGSQGRVSRQGADVRSQLEVLASWSAALSAGSKRSDAGEQLQQRPKKQKSWS